MTAVNTQLKVAVRSASERLGFHETKSVVLNPGTHFQQFRVIIDWSPQHLLRQSAITGQSLEIHFKRRELPVPVSRATEEEGSFSFLFTVFKCKLVPFHTPALHLTCTSLIPKWCTMKCPPLTGKVSSAPRQEEKQTLWDSR